jgi:hypothetical protein
MSDVMARCIIEVTMDDRNAPATKGDVADIMEALRDIETKLLNAFYERSGASQPPGHTRNAPHGR